MCPALFRVCEHWPRLAASPRFRLFLCALAETLAKPDGEIARVIGELCRPQLPSDDDVGSATAIAQELQPALAALAELAGAQSCCSVEQYRDFERRVATNAHGLRLRSPAADALAAAVEAAPSLSPSALRAVGSAVAAVGGELPFYTGTALFARGSALNHSCRPSAEAISSGIAELRLRTTRHVRAGDELTIAYIARSGEGDAAGTEVRAGLLEQYGFRCDCTLCASELSAAAFVGGT